MGDLASLAHNRANSDIDKRLAGLPSNRDNPNSIRIAPFKPIVSEPRRASLVFCVLNYNP